MEIAVVTTTYICIESNFNKSEIHQGTGQEYSVCGTLQGVETSGSLG